MKLTADTLRDATPEQVADAIGLPPTEWEWNCHGVSVALRAAGLEGRVRRGYADDFGGQHSWVELPGGATVVDATAHAWRGGDPEVVFSDEVDRYDACGWRTRADRRPAPDSTETSREPIDLKVASAGYVGGLIGLHDHDIYEDDEDPGVLVTIEQLHWLAHRPVVDAEGAGVLSRFFAAEVYEAISDAGHKALIPIDAWHYVMDLPYPGEPERES